jgi:hypothetical protein
MATEIEVYVQGKKFVAYSLAEVEWILKYFKGWKNSYSESIEDKLRFQK